MTPTEQIRAAINGLWMKPDPHHTPVLLQNGIIQMVPKRKKPGNRPPSTI